MTEAQKEPENSQDELLRQLEQQRLVLRRQNAAVEARDSLMAFTKFTMPDPEEPNDPDRSTYENARHHDAICAALEKVEEGDISFLILTVPPRHGKSELVSRRLPAWFLGRHPEQSVVVATYNDDFAKDFGGEVRQIIRSKPYRTVFPNTILRRGGEAKDLLETTAGGKAIFAGVGGALTGRGAHLLVIDDLIKDYEQARSKAFRDRAWDWFTKVAMSRRMGKKLVIITFTRWHEDDIIGRLTDPENEYYSAKMAKKIKIINFPAIAEDDDPLLRAPGEPLWDRYGLEFLEEQRVLDPLGFEALYQQRPSVADGILFRRENVNFYDPAEIDEREMRIYCASDHAVSTAQRADRTCLLRVGVDDRNNIYLLNCWWRKAPTDQVVEAMLGMGGTDPRPLVWWAEKGHISKSIGPFLKKRMAEEEIYFNVVEVTPAADKETRAQAIAARMAMGFVHFPKGAPWVERAITELLSFPNGNHDDFVDTLAHIGLGLRSLIPVSHPTNPTKEPKTGTLAWLKAQAAKQDTQSWRYGGFD